MCRPTILAVLAVMGASLAVPSHAIAASQPGRRASRPERRAETTIQTLTITKPSFEVPLMDNGGSTGYTLGLESTSKGIYLTNITTEPPARPMPGAPSRKIFHFFSTLKPRDKGHIVFARFQSFDFDKTLSKETYEVRRR